HQQLHDFTGDQRARLRRIYAAEIGVREATGKNDGSRIGEYLRYVGLGEGYAYCAAFVCWSLGEAGIDNPKNGWSPALFPAGRIVWDGRNPGYQARRSSVIPSVVEGSHKQGKHANETRSTPLRSAQGDVQPGDVFGIYYSNLQRIAHCGFVDHWDGTWCITVEANTGPDNAVTARGDPANPIRAGPSEGVHRKRRLV